MFRFNLSETIMPLRHKALANRRNMWHNKKDVVCIMDSLWKEGTSLWEN